MYFEEVTLTHKKKREDVYLKKWTYKIKQVFMFQHQCEAVGVRYRKDSDMMCLDDIVSRVIGSKSVASYLGKIKDKQKIDGAYYASSENVREKLASCKKKTAKEFLTEMNRIIATRHEKVVRNIEHEDERYDDDMVIDKPTPPVHNQRLDGLSSLENTFLDIRNNYLTYNGKDVSIVVQKNVAWFKGIDVATLLDYKDPTNAIYHHVYDEDKTTFEKLKVGSDPTSKGSMHHQTIFITLQGVYDLVGGSQKKEAKVFRRWLSHEVLPSINKTGAYSIEKKHGCFYDIEDLYKYADQNVCYIAYVGVHDGEELFKFGITFDYYRREYQEHRNTFDTFDLLYLRRTDNNRIVEDLFKKECKLVNLYRKLKRDGQNNLNELFTTSTTHSFDRMRMIMDKIIEQYPTQEMREKEEENRTLKEQIARLEIHNSHLERNVEEKSSLIKSLESDKGLLQSMLEKIMSLKNVWN